MRNMLLAASAIMLLNGCTTVDTVTKPSKPVMANSSYVSSVDKMIVKSGSGGCLRSSTWSSDNLIVECHASAKKPVEQVKVSYDGKALFEFDSDQLTVAGQRELNQLVAKLRSQNAVDSIAVTGHADSTGPDTYNQGLSERRAATVGKFLQGSLGKVSVRATGLGESSPAADNATSQGRQQNRRVEVQVKATKIVQ